MSTNIRILALCGYTQNSHIMSKKIGAIRKGCGKNVEFVFLDPPHIVLVPDFGANASFDDLDSSATTDVAEMTPETTPRAWWTTSGNNREVYEGFDETIVYLKDYLTKHGPFDGVLGFSQGAGMAALLTSLLSNPSLHPAFAASPTPIHPPFKFSIFAGGFVPTPKTPDLRKWFPIGPDSPTLHIAGRNDPIVTPERSVKLADACEDSRLEYHDGGHFMPSKASYKNFFRDWINSFVEGGLQGDVPGPTGGSTANSSAVATPREGSPSA